MEGFIDIWPIILFIGGVATALLKTIYDVGNLRSRMKKQESGDDQIVALKVQLAEIQTNMEWMKSALSSLKSELDQGFVSLRKNLDNIKKNK